MFRYLALTFIIIISITNVSYSQTNFHCKVTKIVDGDTLKCKMENGKEENIRLIGIDAPESIITSKAYSDSEKTGDTIETIKEMGEKSKAFVMTRVKVGNKIKLELDIQEKDKYNRTLAYVYLEDGTMLNEILVKEGYAQVSTYPPNVKYEKIFLENQNDARDKKRGFWK